MSIEIPSVWKHRQCPSVPFSARVPALFARQCGNNASKSAGEENRHFLIRERDAVRVGEQVSSQVGIDILTPSPPLPSRGRETQGSEQLSLCKYKHCKRVCQLRKHCKQSLEGDTEKKERLLSPPPPSPGSEWARGVWPG